MYLKRAIKALLVGCVILFPAVQAQAQSLYGDFIKPPRDIKRGFYLGSETGFIFFLNTNEKISNPGFNLALFAGYDILDYLSVEARFRTGLNGGWRNEPILGGIYTLQANGLVRGFYPIKRIFPFIDLGAGIFFTHPDYDVGLNNKFNIEIGFGFDYYTLLRHFSIGLRGAYDYIKGLPDALVFNVNMKYTF